MKKQVLFVLLDQYADWGAAYLASAINMLGQEQYVVKTVSITLDRIQSIGGFQLLPDYDMKSMPKKFEALILIGGMSWRTEEAKQIIPLVEKCIDDGKVLGGICDASEFLGTVGALNHCNHTGNDLTDLKQWAGEAYTNEERYIREQAVRDNNIITANGTAALEFAKEVLLALQIAPQDQIEEWYNFHKLGYYEATKNSF